MRAAHEAGYSELIADCPVGESGPYPVLSSRTAFTGRVVSVRTDEVEMSDGSTAVRDVVVHPGAVGVVALDELDRVVMIRQFRHPVRSYLWELPAGLMDVTGEPLVETARRELAEECGLSAQVWHRLLDLYASPGGSSEQVTVFLARELAAAQPASDFVAAAEELDLEVVRLPLQDAVAAVQAGRVRNSLAVAGVMAAAVARSENWRNLRPAG